MCRCPQAGGVTFNARESGEFTELHRFKYRTALKSIQNHPSLFCPNDRPLRLRQLTAKLGEVFGSEWETRRFAVRSSAVGEDSEEMSAAGQMTTYLGVEGRQEILDAIVKCWASQFSLTALNYKRQYGQAVAGPMAVVVQEMAQADCAGVMFTCDPVTSRPGRIVLTANFGLGESVVSASVDTDSYTLAHSPGVGSNSTKVTLLNKTVSFGCRIKSVLWVATAVISGKFKYILPYVIPVWSQRPDDSSESVWRRHRRTDCGDG